MVTPEIEKNFIKPFGPSILHIKMPQEYIDALNQECEEIINDEERQKKLDVASLASNVFQELFCDLQKQQFHKLNEFISSMVSFFHKEHIKYSTYPPNKYPVPKTLPLQIHNSWFIRSFKNDYNPSHTHLTCNLALIAYLKIPASITDMKPKKTNWRLSETGQIEYDTYTTEGYLDFIQGTSHLFSNGQCCFNPEPGDMYIFPSDLYHCVYPFYGDGERRSFVMNMSI